MSDPYTRVNLRDDVEDIAGKHGMGEVLEGHFATGDLGLEKSAVSFQALKPGARLPFGHRHEQQEELYVVIGGGGRIKLDDEIVEIRALDAIRIAPEVMRGRRGRRRRHRAAGVRRPQHRRRHRRHRGAGDGVVERLGALQPLLEAAAGG